MLFEAELLLAAILADGALVRLLTGVGEKVSLQAALLAASIRTHRTHEGLLARVTQHVPLHVAHLVRSVRAKVALMKVTSFWNTRARLGHQMLCTFAGEERVQL